MTSYTVSTDIAGRVLKVGQQVAFCMAGQAKNMRLARITRVLPQTVELDAEREYGSSPLRRSHSSVCIVETEV
jgi:hypothetical protein